MKLKQNITFGMIKPDATKKGVTGKIIQAIEDAEFKILALKKLKPTQTLVKNFYAVHASKSFYGELVEYMTSGEVIPMVLYKENAVADFRKLIGATDPKQAEEGTIRRLYGESIEANAIHGSDSDENATLEYSHFFSITDLTVFQ